MQTIQSDTSSESERLIGLIAEAWRSGAYSAHHDSGDGHDKAWQQFCKENNLPEQPEKTQCNERRTVNRFDKINSSNKNIS